MERKVEILSALALNLIAGAILWAISEDWRITLTAIVTIAVFCVFAYYVLSFRHVGILGWSRERGSSRAFRSCLSDATSTVDFLATWGGSIPSLSPHIERTFADMVDAGVRFRFLLLMPGSDGERRRRESRGDWPAGQPEADLRWLLSIKESFGPKATSFRIRLYDSAPVWAIVIVDNRRASVGFYGAGVGRDNPALQLGRQIGTSFLDAFNLEYERIWDSATELVSVKHLDDVLSEAGTYQNAGYILAVTGPSGVGKTTICRLLVRSGLGVPSKTVTTRPARKGEKTTGQYEYVSRSRFEKLSQSGEFLCQTVFCGHSYGIRRSMVYEAVEAGRILILDTIIPPQILHERLGRQVATVFLAPRSLDDCRNKILQRGNVSGKELEDRLETSKRQMQQIAYCSYLIPYGDIADETARILEELARSISREFASKQSVFPEEMAHRRTEVVQKSLSFLADLSQ